MSSQADAESKFANAVTWWMRDHDALISNTPITNLVQVFAVVKYGYPYFHHRELVRFGKNAGFNDTLAEKYMFFWPRFTNEYIEGEVLCISTQPFRWGADGLARIYIAKKDGNYIYRSVPEERWQSILQEVKPNVVPVVNVHRMPPLPPEVQQWWTPTLGDRYERFVWDLSGALGQDSSTPVRLGLKVLAGLLLMSLGLLWLVFSRKRPKRSAS